VTTLTVKQKSELDALTSRSRDGKLHPTEVVKFARKASTALHKAFEWDDGRAAAKYRIDQARNLIQVYTINFDGMPTRAYVSIEADRSRGGGYMPTQDALAEEATRELLVGQFKAEIRRVLRQFSYLRGIDEKMFERIEAVVKPSLREAQHGEARRGVVT